jgi:hypothetical protein
MTGEAELDAELIVQLPRDGAVDRNFRADPPPSLTSGRIVLDHIKAPDDELGPPQAGEVVMSVLSPEALRRDQQELRQVLDEAGAGHQPLVIEVEAAEQLREDELAAVLDATAHARRPVILRVLSDA